MNVGRGAQDRELATRRAASSRDAASEQPRSRELAREQRDARGLVERGVVGGDAGAREQLADDRLVHVAVLPQVERGEMEAEHVDGAPQRIEAPRRERRRAVRRERRGDRVEIGAKRRGRRIRLARDAAAARGGT